MYDLTQKISGKLLENKSEINQLYLDWTKILSKAELLKFAPSYNPRNIIELIDYFFYHQNTTYLYDGSSNLEKLQCYSGRRRSLIDFYLIQQYYLEEPLTLEQCSDIYFNKLFRGLINIHDNYTYFYCSTVKANVFLAITSIGCLDYITESLKEYKDLKIKTYEKEIRIR